MKCKLCFFLAIAVGFLWSLALKVEAQPTFAWPVQSDLDHLTGTFGEPRANGAPLGHWHKGIDVPKANGTDVNRPATGKVTFIPEDYSYIVIHYNGGWHTRLMHVVVDPALEKGDPAPEIVGEVTDGHVHLEVYEFGDEQMDVSMYGILEEARNPLRYANLTTYPDANNPTVEDDLATPDVVEGMRFNLNRDWNEENDGLDAAGRFIDLHPEDSVFPTYFIVHAYDDITGSGATAPYKIWFWIEEETIPGWWGVVWEEEWVFDDLLDDDKNVLDLEDVYAEGSSMSNREFYYANFLDLFDLKLNGLSFGEVLNTTGEDKTFRFKAQAFDRAGKASEAVFKDLIVPPAGPEGGTPSAFVDFLSAEFLGDHIEVKFKAVWMPGILGVNILRCEGQNEAYRRINAQVIEVPDTGALRKEYSFSDWNVLPDRKYAYKLEMVSPTGERGIIDHLTEEAILPAP
ncbi:MAG: M23 family metallopeptidase [Candidatus Latescibacterota bacterium]